MRRALAVLASLGLGLGTIALATPAQATSESVRIEDSSTNALVFDLTPGSLSASQIVFDNQSNEQTINIESPEVLRNGQPCTSGCALGPTLADRTFEVAASANAAYVAVSSGPLGVDRNAGVIVTYNGSGGGVTDDSGSSAAAGSAPAPVMQQFGLPASGNCEDGYSDSMDWSGVGSDGWGVSWAQWMNDGSGGVVCSRTVMYDSSTSKWTVN